MDHKLIYGLKDNKIVYISQVSSGKACGCICPSCGVNLIAKKGTIKMHHFAHENGKTCSYGYETSLHMAAKEILSNSKSFMIPETIIRFERSYKTIKLSDCKEIKIDNVVLEKRSGGVIPDIVIKSGGKTLFVEIFVTHKVDDNKLKNIETLDISTIEIDLSKEKNMITEEKLKDILLNDVIHKKWIYNSLVNKCRKRFLNCSKKKRIKEFGLSKVCMNCPLEYRLFEGTIPYANFIDECSYCDFLVKSTNKWVYCTADAGYSELSDFNLSYEERNKKYNLSEKKEKRIKIQKGICPQCGNKLVVRESAYGKFYGCTNYPRCNFTKKC